MKVKLITKANHWEFEKVKPLIRRVVTGAAHGEFSLDDLQYLIQDGRAFAGFVAEEDGTPVVAYVWEMIFYPRTTAVNVIALGGKDFYRCCDWYWPFMQEVWRRQGATVVECSSTPAMARFLQKAGFHEVYRVSRKEL